MKRLLLFVIIVFSSCLFANVSDSLLIDGRYRKINLIQKNLPQEITQSIWNTYLKDMDFYFTFESSETARGDIDHWYCTQKILKDYGISRFDFDERGDFQIQEYIYSHYGKRFFNLAEKEKSLKNIQSGVMIGQNYFYKEKPAYHLTHIEQYSQDIIKAYLHRYNENKKESHTIYAAYLKKRKDNTYYFMCVREIYNAKKALAKKNNTVDLDLKNNCVELKNHGYDHRYSNYFIKEHNNSLYFIGEYIKDNKHLNGILKYDKETMKFQKHIPIPFDIDLYYNQRSTHDDQNIHLTYEGYNLICQTDKDTIITTKRPHHVTYKTVNSAKQTFVNYFNDVSSDQTKAVYVDYQGVILLDIESKQELLIKKMDDNVAWLHSPEFIENDQKVIFFENGDEYTGPVYIYDIAANKLKTTDFPIESEYSFTPQGVVSLFTDYDKSKIKLVRFDSTSIDIPVEGIVERYPIVKFNENYFVFTAGNSLYALNLKTQKVSPALATNYLGQIEPIAVTRDNRIIFKTNDLDYNYRLFMTKPGVLR